MSSLKTRSHETVPATPPVLDPVAHAFIDGLTRNPGPPLYTMSPAAARNVLIQLQSGPVAMAAASITALTLPIGPTGATQVHIVRPEGQGTRTPPAIVYCHGGGWILGNFKTHERLVRALADGTKATVIFVDYAPSPEARFPVAIEQAYAVLKHVAEQADTFGIDGSRIAVAGDSVGGNMAAVLGLLAKERGGPSIAFQALLYPVTSADLDNGSYDRFADGPWLTRPAMAWFWDAYLPDKAARAHRYVSPLNASIEELRGLPPALVITDENDVLRDEGEAFARRLMQANVSTVATRYDGMVHDFLMLDGLASAAPAKAALQQAIDLLSGALHGTR